MVVDYQGRPIRVEREEGRPFTPSLPPRAEMPEHSPPRALVPPYSINLNRTPRTGWKAPMTAFDLLRQLSDDGLVRIAMQDVKGQILGMKWEVTSLDGEKSTPAVEKEIARVESWMRRPDGINNIRFRRFMSKMLEEILVTDALTLIPRYSVKGDFIGIEQIDGATIMPLVDARGNAPLPPREGEERTEKHVAYEQIVDGRIETQFTRDEIHYLPANPRSDNPYGRSPTEMVLLFINLALRMQMFDLSWFTEGNMPEGLFSVPEQWTPEMIATYQRGFTDEGRDGSRAGYLRFVPQGAYHPLKDHKFELDSYEFIARAICFAFGVSPMPLVKAMNRATAETMEVSSLESGVRPVAEHIAEALTLVVQGPLDAPMLQIRPGSDETEDATTVFQRNIAYYNRGGLSINEFMSETGGEPIAGDGGNLHMIESAAGPVFLEDILAQRAARLAAPPVVTPSVQQEASGGGAAPPTDDAAAQDLARWQTFALKRLRTGHALRKFESGAITGAVRARVEFGLTRARTSGQVKEVFAAARMGKAAEIEPPALAGPRATIEGIVNAWLEANRKRIIADAVAILPAEKLVKADLFDGLNLDMSDLVDALRPVLAQSAGAGVKDTAALVGFSLDNVPQAALEYAKNRAAELVGMKWVNDQLVENPNKTFAINETLRSEIRTAVTTAIENGQSPQELTSILSEVFDRPRAETIARTETGFAYNEGAATVYEEAEVDHLEILDGDGCLPYGHKDGSPAPSGAEGVVEETSEANGQIWTVSQFRRNLLGHPRCVRGGIPA